MTIYRLDINDSNYGSEYGVSIYEKYDVVETPKCYIWRACDNEKHYKKSMLGTEIFLTKQDAINYAIKITLNKITYYYKKIENINKCLNNLKMGAVE